MDINPNHIIILIGVAILLQDWVSELLNTDWSKRNDERAYKRDIF